MQVCVYKSLQCIYVYAFREIYTYPCDFVYSTHYIIDTIYPNVPAARRINH